MSARFQFGVLLALLALVGMRAACAAQPAEVVDEDPSAVFRFDPISNELVAVPAAEVRPGFIYYHFNPRLNRRVWSLATANGGFEYAMAPDSVQPARLLDLHATPEQLRSELVENAPEVAKIMDIRGGIAYVRLTADQRWVLVRQPTIANVYDLETLRRWEWHGERRVAVMHTAGYDWLLVDGKFVPASYRAAFASGCCW